mgnify:CR=1 FL=1
MTKTWTPEQFWEYVEGLTDAWTRDDIREMLTERGLCVLPQSPVLREAREKEITRLATIEECARVAEAQAQEFLSPQYASNQPFGSTCERFACEEVAKAIRALSDTRPLQTSGEANEQ